MKNSFISKKYLIMRGKLKHMNKHMNYKWIEINEEYL